MVRRGLRRGCKAENIVDVEEKMSTDGGSKRNRSQEGSLQRGQKKRGRASNADRHAQLDEDVRREARDPYHLHDPDHYPRCTREDHARRKNCANNPRCLYGLGEGKQGIWSSNPSLLLSLGEDKTGTLRAGVVCANASCNGSNEKPTGSSCEKGDVALPFPSRRLPAGLKNLGATCYLNSQLQALFANKGFRRGVYAWRPPKGEGVDVGCNSVDGKVANGSSLRGDHRKRRKATSPYSTETKLESLGGDSSGGGAAMRAGSTNGVDASSEGFPGGVDMVDVSVVGGGMCSTKTRSREDKDDKIMEELQRVFGHMQEGISKVYDPGRFAKLLGIDNGVQQDPQEFNKLFMSLLERCLRRSPTPLQTLVSGLFCGELAYVTRCLTCKLASRNKNAFNELELQIGSNRKIETCLDSFLEVESLDGDNQYFCEQCDRKRDAVRAIELHRLPPVLSIQLLRYVYDAKTGQRKKIKAPVSLAPTLDMGPRLGPQGKAGACSDSEPTADGGNCVYKLACVLYHKGSNVHSGHYVAEVHDPSSDTWTLFDDGKVRRLAGGINSHAASLSGGGGPAADATSRGKAKRNPRALQKGGDRGCEVKGDPAAAVATPEESDFETEFLGSADGIVAESPDAGRKEKSLNLGMSSGDDDFSMTPSPDDDCKQKPKGKGKGKANCTGGGKQQGVRGIRQQRGKRPKTVTEELSADEEIDVEMTEVLPKPSHASTNSGGSSRREKVFHARGKRRGVATTSANRAGPKGRVTSSKSSITNGRAKGKKISDDEQIEEGDDEKDSNEGGDDEQEDSEGDDGGGRAKKDKQGGEEDVEGCEGAGDNGVVAVVGDDGAGCKKQRGSEDAYMLIYVREGVDWGIGGEIKGDVALPEHVREAVRASNVALAREVSRFQEGKRRLEAEMRRRRERYCRLFVPPLKTTPTNRKGGNGGGKAIKGTGDNSKADADDEKGTCNDDVSDDVIDDVVEETRVDASAQGGRRPSQGNGADTAASTFRRPGPSDEQLLTDTGTSEEARDVSLATTPSLADLPEQKCSKKNLPPPGAGYFWIPSNWLQQWVVGEKLPPPDEAAGESEVVIVDGSDRIRIPNSNPDAEGIEKLAAKNAGVDGAKGVAGDGKGVANGGAGIGDTNGRIDVGGGRESEAAVARGVFAEPIRNAGLLCEHGKLHPASVSRWKLVTREVYEGLLEEQDMGPPDCHVSAANFRCDDCVRDYIGRKESNIMASRESGLLVAELERSEPVWNWQDDGQNNTYSITKRPFAISRKWVADFKLYHEQFLRSATKDAAGQAKGSGGASSKAKASSVKPPDERVNSSITCEHGSLVSGRRGVKRKYRLISAEGWGMIRKRFPLSSELEYPAGTRPCSVCQEQDEDETQLKLDRRKSKTAELQKGPSLRNVLRRGGALPPKLYAIHRRRVDRDECPAPTNYRFFLAEASWLAAWRAHHDSSSIHSEHPGPLLNQGLRCEHGLAIMGQRLRRVVEGLVPALAGVSEEGAAAEAEILTETEWADLARTGVGEDDEKRADSSEGGGTTPDGTTSPHSSGGTDGSGASSSTFEVSFGPQSGWSPGVCDVCMTAASDRANMARSIFKDKAVNIVTLKEDEAPPAPDPAATSDGADGVQLSASGRPQRRTRAKGAPPLVVTCNSDETVNFLKLKVYQSIEVPPRRQTLFLRAVSLGEGTNTLQQAGVKAGDTLHLKVEKASASDAADDASIDDTQLFTEVLTTKPPPGPERGFAGTALSADRRSPPPPPNRLSPSRTPGASSTVDLVEVEGGYMEIPRQGQTPFVACPTCTFHNDLTEERCSACGVALFE